MDCLDVSRSTFVEQAGDFPAFIFRFKLKKMLVKVTHTEEKKGHIYTIASYLMVSFNHL